MPNTKFGSNVGMEVISENTTAGYIRIKLFSTNPQDASPSKPQDLVVGLSGGHPMLTWAQMQEPDVQAPGGSVRIERRLKPLYSSWSNWSEIGSTPGTGTSYIDDTIQQGCQGSCPDSVQYRIRALDNTNKYSVYSDPVSKTYYYFKQGNETEISSSVPNKFELYQNYPNPFNPTTTIDFDLPINEFASLKIFDVLGKEVQTLASELKKAGSYKVAFDASKLASGVYIYKLTSGNFSASKKLLLMK